MNKDEMKNKISMALKDPILQQGFEIICKENAELQEENKKMADLDTALEDCTESLTDARIKIKELEQENEELKERNAKLKGMYAHSAREASTYKQFLELKEKENEEKTKE